MRQSFRWFVKKYIERDHAIDTILQLAVILDTEIGLNLRIRDENKGRAEVTASMTDGPTRV